MVMSKHSVVFKRLELFGFKSFAEKTVFDFEPGLTAIVGPNGCGKSNVADSIRWVLGEQRPKALRGTRMEDVICNGGDRGEPLNLAEVSLTFSNENKILPVEYDEVTVTRRLYRSGESEYFLNRTPVRLKDINELFMDTGIGTESYSIIEQGKIDLILSNRPEDRRFLFEEAAGITKFKAKKKEAERKLEQTEGNLLRINDIITEVKRQLDSIQRQVSRAQRYQEIFERMKTLETGRAAREYRRLRKTEDRIREQNREQQCREGTLAAEIDAVEEQRRRHQEELLLLDEQVASVNAAVAAMDRTLDQFQSRIAFNRERIVELNRRQESLRRDREAAAGRVEGLGRELERLREEAGKIEEEKTARRRELEEREKEAGELQLQVKEAAKYVEDSKTKAMELAARISRLKNDLTRMEANLQSLQLRRRRLGEEKASVQAELSRAEEKFKAAQAGVEEAERRVNAAVQEKNELTRELNLSRQELVGLEAAQELKNRELAASQSRLELLAEMKRTHEGFSPPVKAILSEKEKKNSALPGVQGVVAELIEVGGGGETAVEAVLGAEVESVVTADGASARQAAEYLRTNSLGRVKFLYPWNPGGPARAGDDGGIKAEILADPGVEGELSGWVKIEEKYRSALAPLFRAAYLVKATDAARELIDRLGLSAGAELKFVTRQGEVIQPGALTAGARTGSGELGLIGREAKIRQLQETCSALNEGIQRLGEERESKNRTCQQTQERLAGVESTVRSEELNLNKLIGERDNVVEEKRRLNEEHSLAVLEIEEVDGEIGEIRSRENALREELQKGEQEDAELQAALTGARELIQSASARREWLLLEISRLKAELAGMSERAAGFAGSLNLLGNSLAEQEEKEAAARQEMENDARRIEELERENSDAAGRTEALETERSGKRTETETIGRRRGETHGRLVGLEGKSDSLKNSLASVKEETHHCLLEEKDITFKLETITRRMRDAYHCDLDALPGEETAAEEDAQAIETQIEEYRRKLEAFGQVNLGAIEEDAELKQRHAFLTGQRQDLEEARDSLNKAIVKINRTTRDLFSETFVRIEEAFKESFRHLFGGGSAELILLEGEDMLEAGIEIIARPPGKKPQSISLLSGGEKAMTATALLFAILRVKPTPFCILDEIDASLDEANIGRFTRMLQDFLPSSQFIVITHNKKTIGMADVMYGVTMEQSGMSKIVSVKFAEPRPPAETEMAVKS